MYALYIDGIKHKEASELPTIDQTYPVGMAPGHEWLTIIEDAEPAFDPMTQVVKVTEVVEPDRKLRKTRTVQALSPELAAAQTAKQQEAEAQAAAEAARIAKRPKRTQINAVLAGIEAATTIATLRAETLKLAGMMSNILVFQKVEVDEDIN